MSAASLQSANEKLRHSEVRYRRLFEAARDGILLLDAETGKILDANPFMTELLGYSHQEYLDKFLWEIGAFADLVANRAAFRELTENRYIRYDDLPLKAKDGHLVEVEFVSNVYREDGGDTIQCNIRDITGRKLTEKKLFQSQKLAAVGILTGGVAHNINNLLAVIVGNLELLPDEVARHTLVSKHMNAALDAALRAAELIRRMLAYARQQQLTPRRVDVDDLVTGAARTLDGLLGEEVKVVLQHGTEPIWPVLTDAAQLEASLVNLAVNALEAMPRGGTLTIATRNRQLDGGMALDLVEAMPAEGDYVEIAVTDTGNGIAPEVLPHIFEPFYSTKELAARPGTGLGLSTVFGFIRQSGGNIGVESKVGAGTTIRLYLPRLHEDAIAPVASPPARKTAGGHETVLVVEDNALVRKVVVRQIAQLGYQVIEAEDAARALAKLSAAPVELLFSDIVMPGPLNGLQLAQAARSRWPALKILLTTGFGDASIRSAESGLPVLGKPYRAEQLAQALRAAIDSDVRSTQTA